MDRGTGRSWGFIGSIIIIFFFIIACLFIYWAVEYWVDHNFDSERYEIIKIQPAGGGDSWSFWKLDRRTGNVEYCSLKYLKAGDERPQFTCISATHPDSDNLLKLRNDNSNAKTVERLSSPTTAGEMTGTPATPAR